MVQWKGPAVAAWVELAIGVWGRGRGEGGEREREGRGRGEGGEREWEGESEEEEEECAEEALMSVFVCGSCVQKRQCLCQLIFQA